MAAISISRLSVYIPSLLYQICTVNRYYCAVQIVGG